MAMWSFTPPIICESLYKKVHEHLGRPTALNGPKQRYLLTGHFRCGECGVSVTGGSRWGRFRRYRCREPLARMRLVGKPCYASYIEADLFESLVWSDVVNALKNPMVLVRDLQRHLDSGEGNIGEEIARLDKEIKGLKRQEMNYAMMAADPDFDVDVVKTANAPVLALRQEKQREKDVLEAQKARHDDAAVIEEQLTEYCQKIAENIDSVTDFDGKREVLAAFDVMVSGTKDEVRITANINPERIDSIQNATTIEQTLALRREYIHRLPLA